MDPLLSKEEQAMREKLRGHEFPFDEKAWGAMKTILEEKSDKPVAGMPTVRHEPVPGPGKRWIPLLLLGLVSCLGVSALLWHHPPAFLVTTEAPNSAQQINTILPATAHSSAPLTTTESPNPTQQINTTLPAATQPPAHTGALPEIKSVQVSSPGISKQQATEFASEIPSYLVPAPLETKTEKSPVPDTRNLPTPLPPALPYPALRQTPKPDSLILPGKEIARSGRRMEHGLLAGINANTVATQPSGMSVLPHAGYFLSYRIKPRTSLQIEAIAKYVSGYRMGGSQLALGPSGSLTDPPKTFDFDLFFVEIPVLFKHHTGTQHALLLGLKPGVTLPRFAAVSEADMDNFESILQSDRAGIRRFDLGITLGWEWQFARRFALDLRYNQGLTDLSSNQVLLNNNQHLNSGLQLSVRALLGKKVNSR